MQIEKNNPINRLGWIEVICGSMFSGKTEELIRRLKRAKIARQKVEIFKPEIDKRYDEINVVSHDENAILSTPVQSASQILLLTNDVDVVGIDEAQFFDNELPSGMQSTCQQRHPGDRGGARHGLSREALRPDARPDRHRRRCDQSARRLQILAATWRITRTGRCRMTTWLCWGRWSRTSRCAEGVTWRKQNECADVLM